MKRYLSIVLIILVSACSSELEKKKTELKDLNTEMKDLKTEMQELQVVIDTLQNQIALLDSAEIEVTGILVNSVIVQPQLFEHYFEVTGIVNSDVDVTLSPEAPGTVKRILVKKGQRVSKGQLIAELNSTVGQSNIEEVESQLELAKIIYEKRKKLWDQNIGSEVEYLQAKTNYESLQKRLQATKSQVNLSAIYATASGTIEDIYTKQGELLSPGVPFASLVSLQNVYLEAEIPENYLGAIKKGDKVKVSVPGESEPRVLAISRVGNVINPGNRSFTVQIAIPNKDQSVKLNSICAVEVCDYKKDNSLVLPSYIIQQDAKGYFVYEIQKQADTENAIKTYVEIGPNNKGNTLVLTGIEKDDEIITDGYNEVSNNAIINRNEGDEQGEKENEPEQNNS
ncbi:MAG: efflux RND transporter periplasmic adaptor subunit [Bacteroidia bacterium]|nr:efflux RND transporter periplasmic adaptor subunit [Bacteroidia bacterium]NNC86234.1 efflux RND transporter periplasmic adaptor subunit [Bacteroidia bacterium]NNM15613.1 efflux RND transporter periplasmic adaptor subunit [Bacteroidia bacterium]